MDKDERVVYFVGIEGPMPAIKIGTSRRSLVGARVSSIQTCLPFILNVIGVIRGGRAAEKELHLSLRAHHIRGEWFHDNAAVRSIIEKCIADDTLPETFMPHERTRDRIMLLRAQGRTWAAIGLQLGVSRQAVQQYAAVVDRKFE